MKKFIFNLQRFATTVTTAAQFTSALSKGETDIIVNGNFSVTSAVTISKSCKITINKDKTITYTGGGRFLAVNSGVNFQLATTAPLLQTRK